MVKQISIIGNMKKTYMQPDSEIVLVNTENFILEGSLHDEQSGNPDMSKFDSFENEEVNFEW